MVWLPLISVTMIKKLLILVLLLPMLAACHYGNKKQNGISYDGDDTSVEGTWQGIEPFHCIDVSGVTKVVVFIRDSSSVMIDGRQVGKGDPRICINEGVLHVSPIDKSEESSIQSVRIYTPTLDKYVVKDCGEANLSGDTLRSKRFVLNVQKCNVFRGNACLAVANVNATFHKMLMANLDLKSIDFTMKADSVQYINLIGSTRFSKTSYGQKKGRVDISDLIVNK